MQMDNSKKKYVVRTISSFYNIYFVSAKDEEEAKFIASNADYNSSIHLGDQFLEIFESSELDLKRTEEIDEYMFKGVSTVDDEGYLVYYADGSVLPNMTKTKIR